MVVKDNLTVCIPTSIMKTSPDTCLVEHVISELFSNSALLGCRVIVSLDYNPDRFGSVSDEYLKNLIDMASRMEDPQVEVIWSSPLLGWVTGQRQSFLNMANLARTPYILHFEHDWVFKEVIPFDRVLSAMESHNINYVGFNKRPNIRKGCDYILEEDSTLQDCVLTKSSRYSNNPHIAKRSFWVGRIFNILSENTKIMESHVIERPVYNNYRELISREGFESAHSDWRTYIYGGVNYPPTIEHICGHRWSPDNA